MGRVRHEVPGALRGVPIDELARSRVVRFADREPDWDAFADSRIEGRRRGQVRMIGAGGSGKDDPGAVPAGNFTLSMMILPPGQGGSAHTHEVEEAFFVLEGRLTVFFQDADGRRAEAVLGPRDVVSCPAGVAHGFRNDGGEDVLMQVMIGSGAPGPIGFVDQDIQAEELRRRSARGR